VVRGTFNPWLRLGEAAAALVGAAWLVVWVHRLGLADPTASWARTDARTAPVAFLLGLLVGHVIGRKRLALLRRVWPELEGRFFITESAALVKYGDASSFVQLQLSAYAWAGVAAVCLTTYSAGRMQPWSSVAAFAAACLLTGKAIPLALLWAERRRGVLGSPTEAEERAVPGLTERQALQWLAADALVRLALGLLLGAAAVGVATHAGHAAGAGGPEGWALVNRLLGAIGLLAGAVAGYPVGAKRLRLLRQIWPKMPRFLFLVERGLLAGSPGGRSVVRLEKATFIIPLALWVLFLAVSKSRAAATILIAWYFFGWYVAGLTVPFVRLWLEVRRHAKHP
jgi:hypothetical protein